MVGPDGSSLRLVVGETVVARPIGSIDLLSTEAERLIALSDFFVK